MEEETGECPGTLKSARLAHTATKTRDCLKQDRRQKPTLEVVLWSLHVHYDTVHHVWVSLCVCVCVCMRTCTLHMQVTVWTSNDNYLGVASGFRLRWSALSVTGFCSWVILAMLALLLLLWDWDSLCSSSWSWHVANFLLQLPESWDWRYEPLRLFSSFLCVLCI